MLVRVAISVRDVGLRQRVRRALAGERFSSVVVTELGALASEPGGTIEGDSHDLVVVDVPPAEPDGERATTPTDARKLVDALAALPERPGLIILHPTDDSRSHAALLAELEVPPLRERPGDVRELAERYAAHFALRLGRAAVGIEGPALAALEGYAWPGNVRELVNVIERAVLLAIGPAITLADLPPAITRPEHPSRGHVAHAPGLADPERPGPTPDMLSASDDASVMLPREWLEQPWKQVRELLLEGERDYLIGVLQASSGRIGASARAAGLAERSLFEKMKRHGLRKEDFRGPRR